MATAFLLPTLALGAMVYMDGNRGYHHHRRTSPREETRRRRTSPRRFVEEEEEEEEGEHASCQLGCPLSASTSASASAQDSSSRPFSVPVVAASYLGDAETGWQGLAPAMTPATVTGWQGSASGSERMRSKVLQEYGNAQYRGLDGQMHGAEHFMNHHGAAPNVRPKQEGWSAEDENMAQWQLDRRTGDSRIVIERQEIGPMFEPSVQAKTPWGAPHMVNELEERMRASISTKQGGVNPFEQIMVGPGGTSREQQASNLGFNAGNEWRDMNGGRGIYKTVDDLRVREKVSGMNKPGLNGVPEYSVKQYYDGPGDGDHGSNAALAQRASKKRGRVVERGPEHWNLTTGTLQRERGDQFVITGWESERKRSDNTGEYFGGSSMLGVGGAGINGIAGLGLDGIAGKHEPARRGADKREGEIPLGNATARVDLGADPFGARATRSETHTNRSFNHKYMEGDEHTFYGAATDMLKGVTVAMGFGGDTGKNKSRRLIGNPRPLGNVDTAHRLGGVIYDPATGADVVHMSDMNQFSFVGNPDRGANTDSYVTMSLTEALKPKESTFYDEQGSRLSNARATQLPDANWAQENVHYSVPGGADRKEHTAAYDHTQRMSVNGGGNKSAVQPIGSHADIQGVRSGRFAAASERIEASSKYLPAPTMVGYNNAVDLASREIRNGMNTRTTIDGAATRNNYHPSQTRELLLSQPQYEQNPMLFSHSAQFGIAT